MVAILKEPRVKIVSSLCLLIIWNGETEIERKWEKDQKVEDGK